MKHGAIFAAGILALTMLEAGGQPILETTPPEYVVTYTFPANDPNEKGRGIQPLPFNDSLGLFTEALRR